MDLFFFLETLQRLFCFCECAAVLRFPFGRFGDALRTAVHERKHGLEEKEIQDQNERAEADDGPEKHGQLNSHLKPPQIFDDRMNAMSRP